MGVGAEERDSATIGIVERVSPSIIEVAVLREAPHGTGLREGTLHRFPRINSYVVLPSERGSILAIVVWLGIDDDQGRSGTEPDRIGLPTPRRRLRALPLGVLRSSASLLDDGQPKLRLDRGVLLFPTVGDPVRLPTRAEVASAVPGEAGDRLTVPIGRAPLAGDATVRIDPNRLFGRHLAVLGNTGSGKSCTVAQLLRSSAVAAGVGAVGFRAIVLDLNGEYENAFDDLGEHVPVRRFTVLPKGSAEQLRVPFWIWNYKEWLSFTDASAKSQAPQLRRALHLLRTTDFSGLPRAVVGLVAGRRVVRQYEAAAVESKGHKDCLSVLDNTITACNVVATASEPDVAGAIRALATKLDAVVATRRGDRGFPWSFDPALLNHQECADLLPLFATAIEALGVPEFLGHGHTIDSPIPFDAENLIELLPLLAADSGPEVVGWVAPLVERLRIALADDRLEMLSGWQPDEDIASWLKTYLADGRGSQIAVLDLSLVPSNVLHLVTAVFARVVLEALERHRRESAEQQVPTLLVVEEAHALIRRRIGGSDDDEAVPMARLCREAFERISREGRKFGLSLVISSQRPSELSETVLSQCNTFLIHRLVNDLDQSLVRRLVPDSLGSLTDELPALPSQTALLVGWAIDVPTMVRVQDLAEMYRPRSADPDYGATWRGENHGTADWGSVAANWIAVPEAVSEVVGSSSEADPDEAEESGGDEGPEDDQPF
jgi:DNA helicase HerA-like ATPase